MYKRDGVYQTKNISKGVNSCKYIVLHHTGVIGGGNLPILLWQKWSKVSAHFLITRDWKAYKLSDPKKITRHAGKAQRGKILDVNANSLGIEIEGSNTSWFTDKQYARIVELVTHLQTAFGIKKENILKHSDITWSGSKNMQLWDGKSPARKIDVSPKLWRDRWFANFSWRREAKFLVIK